MEHPREVEFADRQREHRECAGDDARAQVRQHDRREARGERCAEARRAFLERAQIGARGDGRDRADHERQREHDVADDDEPQARAERGEAAVDAQQCERGREARQRDGQHERLLDQARDAAAAARERVAGGHARDERDGERRERDFERQEYRAVILRPHLAEPAQREPARRPAKIIDREPGEHRHRDGYDQERAQRERDRPLRGGEPVERRAADGGGRVRAGRGGGAGEGGGVLRGRRHGRAQCDVNVFVDEDYRRRR
ncbi:ABC transporter, permease domain protein [Burkholderia pseudomallei]|nr:ABC transporter, permease domain protein [Burkholderia pseudomallei]